MRRVKKRTQTGREFVNVVELAFPHDKDAPPIAAQLRTGALVALGIAFEFRTPEGPSRSRYDAAMSADVPVPEAAMHENNGASGHENQIGPAGQGPAMQPIAIAHCGEQSTHDHFGAGVFSAYGGHATGALLGRKNVHDQTFTNVRAQSMKSATRTNFTPSTFG